MELTRGLQESLVALLCFGEGDKGAGAVVALVPPQLYDPVYKEIARAAGEYYKQYSEPPGTHTLEIVEGLKARFPDRASHFDAVYASLLETSRVINPQYVFQQAETFVRQQRLREGIVESLEKLEAGDIDGAASAIERKLKSSHSLFDAGVRLDDTARSLGFLEESYKAFECGIKELDEGGLGPAARRLHIFAAPPGRGKTWWLIHLAKTLIRSKRRVLYVTLELEEKEICQRVVQSLFAASKRAQKIRVPVIKADDAGHMIDLEVVERESHLSFDQQGIRTTLESKVKKFHPGKLFYVREFPTGSLTIAELDAYLDLLESAQGFIPDVVIVDYADNMKLDTRDYRHALSILYKDLRGIAMRRHLAMATASQINRDGAGARTSTGENIAESYDKVAHADVLLTYNQTEVEHRLNLARLYVAKGRTDRDRFSVLVAQSYATGQFALSSHRVDREYWERIKEHE